MNAYCNMSVPPRTQVAWTIVPVGELLVFDLAFVAGAPRKAEEAEFREWFDAFARENAEALENVRRPDFYMASVKVTSSAMRKHGYPLCNDKILTFAIVSRMSDGIYIPGRQPTPRLEHISAKYAFQKGDFA